MRALGLCSRLFLQQQRKQQNIQQKIYQTLFIHSPTYRNLPFLQQKNYIKSLPTTTHSIFQNQQILNLISQITQSNTLPYTLIQKQQQNNKNLIKIIQYQANNTIEDRVIASQLKSISGSIVSIFDGHGGDKLSQYCANHVVELTEQYLQQHLIQQQTISNIDQLITNALKYAYHELQHNFYNNIYTSLVISSNRKIKNVGTCALTIIVYKNKIYVANCGDSQAILVQENSNKQIKYIQLNQRLSVNNPIQRQRIIKQFPNDDDIVVEQNTGSFYVKGRLQPTRTLGDYYLKYNHLFKGKGKFNGPYIKSQPDIQIFAITQNHKCIVMGSDGIWDFIDKKTVAKASLHNNAHQQILQQTLKKIAKIHNKSIQQIKQVQAKQKRAYHDDISIAVIQLNKNDKKQTK